MIEKFRAIINKEIKEENEPKETAVLVRVLCLIDCLFLALTALFLFIDHGVINGVTAVSFVIAFIVVLALSYTVRVHNLIGIYYVVCLVGVLWLMTCLGLQPMYQGHLFVVFMIYFYRSNETSFSRIVSVVLSGVVALVAIFYVINKGPLVVMSEYGQVAFIIINTVYVFLKLVLIAYYFRIKFSASETKILQYSRRLEMIATTDPLTKLQNRRGMFTYLERLVEDKNDKEFALTLGIGDIDYFKKINDTYGHEAGDYVLETLSKLMKEFMNGKGMVARWGGEEFLFAFDDINGDYAFESLSKLLHLIERYEFSYNGIDFHVTMTFGIEEYDDNEGIEKTVSRADEKLYMGKEAGRDRVIY